MKKRYLFTLLSFLYISNSCTNLADSPVSSSSDNSASPSKTIVIFNGSIGVNGAVPSELQCLVNDTSSSSSDTSDSSRSAMPTLNFSDSDNPLEYFATATADGKNPVNGSFESGQKVFTIPLETDVEWTVTAGVREKNTPANVLISDSYKITLSASNTVMSHTFVPVPTTKGKGSIDLWMDKVPSGVTSLKLFVDGEEWLSDKVKTKVSSSVETDNYIITATENGEGEQVKTTIDSGAYEVTLKFYKGDYLAFATVQTINVFDNMTTNTWVDDGTGLIDEGKIKLTANLMKSFLNTTLYVGDPGTGKNPDDGNAGTAYSPLKTLNAAINMIADRGNPSKDYRILISGEISGNANISSSLNSYINSLTIEKADGVEKAVLKGDGTASVIRIGTKKPVTFRNVQITGGYAHGGGENSKGGGIFVAYQANVILDSGTLVGDATETPAASDFFGNKADISGGGIYVDAGTLTLKKGSKVCRNYAGSHNEDRDSGGGGIASMYGIITIEDGSSISYNKTVGRGGGIYLIGGNFNSPSTLTMNGGEISYNETAYWGGGLLIGSASGESNQGENCKVRFYFKGGEIHHNKSTSEDYGWGVGGGGVTVDHSYMEMRGSAKIHHNESENEGGGLRIGSNSVFLMSGGEISNNTCHRETDTDGTPVSGGALDIEPNSKVVISGSAKIPYGIDGVKGYRKNDIWLRYASGETPSYITVGGALTSTFEMGIGVNGKRGLVIAQADGTNVTDLTPYKDYFKIINTDWLTNLSSKTKIVLDAPLYVAGQDTHPVCGVAGSASGNGTKGNPFDSIASAIAEINSLNVSTDYTILIDGELKPTVSDGKAVGQTIGTELRAKSLTIRGASSSLASNGEPKDSITGVADSDHRTRTLKISPLAPIIIENLKITGGSAPIGGGIFLNGGTNLTLGNDVLITENEALAETDAELELQGPKGAGIYCLESTVTLNVRGNAKVYGNKISGTETPSNVYLAEGAKITITGALTKESDMAKIGVSTEIDPTSETAVTVTSGYNSYNAGVNPGVYFRGDKYGVKEGLGTSAGEAVISPSGGALIVESLYKNIQIKADKTSFSKAALPKTINFTAVAIADDGTEIDSPLTIAASGDNNVVISAKLSYHGESVKSDFYSVGTGSLELKSGLAFGDYTLNVIANYKDRSYSANFPIVIRETVGTKSSSQEKAVGDIVFNDGSAMPYTEYAVLDDDSKNDLKTKAIALIFYNGTGLNSGSDTTTKRTLGMGLGCGEILPWCSDSSSSRYKRITPISCYATGGFPPNTEFTTTGQDDRNGSDNLEQIADFLGTDDDTSIEENYPALYWAKNYKDCILTGESSSRIKAGSAFENGWYLPSSAELYMFWKNGIYENAELDLNTASQALGGIDFTNKMFMTSSQSTSPDCVDALALTIYAGNTDIMVGAKDGSTNPGYPIAIREF